jgi:hypothetical protein
MVLPGNRLQPISDPLNSTARQRSDQNRQPYTQSTRADQGRCAPQAYSDGESVLHSAGIETAVLAWPGLLPERQCVPPQVDGSLISDVEPHGGRTPSGSSDALCIAPKSPGFSLKGQIGAEPTANPHLEACKTAPSIAGPPRHHSTHRIVVSNVGHMAEVPLEHASKIGTFGLKSVGGSCPLIPALHLDRGVCTACRTPGERPSLALTTCGRPTSATSERVTQMRELLP